MRSKSVKVKTAKNRSISSTAWLRRQLNDEYILKAKSDGYRSRAAYKLLEIDAKFSLIKSSSFIIDLGAAPGGWSQVLSNKIGEKGKIVAIDLLEMPEIPSVDFIQGDFCDLDVQMQLRDILARKADVILSDMAPNTTGHKETDHLKIMDLCERVLDFADIALNIGGSIVIKIFQGGAQGDLLQRIKKSYKLVKHFKPISSRKDSSELYLIGIGYQQNTTIEPVSIEP
ncbi:MAG: RlmE family RNA methyltransferase [Alphaproteobacteria bacterium]|nr:RlmE family RNA methyltransferase [Alphaproteobacteria bacterium]